MEHINIWASGVDEPMDPYLGTFTQDFTNFDGTSQYDYTSQYAHSSAPPSEVDFANSRGVQPKYYSSQTPKVTRRESARSIPQSQVQYSDSGYYSATTMSPTTIDMEFFPSFPQTNADIAQDYLMYVSYEGTESHRDKASDTCHSMEQAGPESPNASSDEETTGSSTESIIPPRSDPLYNAAPHADGLYHCPFLATEDCGHEPKMLKCEYEYVEIGSILHVISTDRFTASTLTPTSSPSVVAMTNARIFSSLLLLVSSGTSAKRTKCTATKNLFASTHRATALFQETGSVGPIIAKITCLAAMDGLITILRR
jgi:hypothetical protein